MRTLFLDTETTTYLKGSVYASRNFMVVAGTLFGGVYREHWYDDCDSHVLRWLFAQANLVVCCNAKFDLNWIRRAYGIEYHGQVWCCQVAHFISVNQTETYPSLEGICRFHGIPGKLDVVKTEFWDKGIDTDAIPRQVLGDYLRQDVSCTARVYEKQRGGPYDRLVLQHCWDTLALAEMEWNGMAYDVEGSMNASCECRYQIEQLDKKLSEVVPEDINWSSWQQVSAVLYGGTIKYEDTEEYIFHYKDSRKAPATKTRKVVKEKLFPRLVQPIKNKGEEDLSVNEGVIAKLQAKGKARKILDILKERTKLRKLNGTYYYGIPGLIFETGGEQKVVHGSLNQVVVVSGRLSSNKPNLQNNPPQIKEFFVSRYED